MRSEFWAIVTAGCWAIGSYFEKKGVKLGGFAPVMGTMIRTAFSLLILSIASRPYWPQVKAAGYKPVLMIAFGGGLLAGAAGIFCLYRALSSGSLSTTLTLAFCLTPVFGAVMGALFMNEKLTVMQTIGLIMTLAGSAMVALYRQAAH